MMNPIKPRYQTFSDKKISLPNDWKTNKLGNLAKVFSGGTPSRDHPEYYFGDIPWIKSGELNQRYVRWTEEKITKDGLTKSSAKLIQPETLLMALYGATSGIVAIAKISAAINQAVLAIKPSLHILNSEFLFQFLEYARPQILAIYQQGGQPNLSGEIVKSLQIPLPPINEQVEIAHILSTWDRAIERVQRLIEAKQRLKKGLMQGLLTGRLRFSEFGESICTEGDIPSGWEETKLKNLADIIVSNVDKLTNENEHDVLLCNYMDVYSNEYITNKIEFMQATASQPEISKYRLFNGDVLLTKDSETSEDIASTAVLMEDIENLLCGYHLAILRPNKDIANPVFLSKHLSFGKNHKHFVTHANGVTRYGLSLSSIINTPICLPCLEEQRKIADLIMKIDREISTYSQMLEMYVRQKKGLMQKLLTGEIRVKVN